MSGFHSALAEQANRVCAACADLARAPDGDALTAADRFSRAFNDALDTLTKSDAEIATNRVRKQAMGRARANGIDPDIAAEEAERCLHEGMSHENAITAACGPYQPKEIAA